jgi:hypothetical protein
MAADLLRIETLDLRIAPFDWAFARERRAEIDAHFEAQRRDKPGMWNGRVLLMHAHEIDGACLRGRFFETDFASFMAWRDFDFPGGDVTNCFALGALQGTPDLNDIAFGKVDLDASVRREVAEETGLDPADFTIDAGWHCLPAGPMLALLKPMRSRETAQQIRDRIRAHIAREAEPELADAYVARGAADIDPMMPGFIQTFLRSAAG